MAVGERERRHLQEALVQSLGPEPTDTLMGYLPPVGWADVATKHDLAVLGDSIRAELRSEISGVRGEIAELRGELRSEISGVRGEFSELRAWVHAELRTQFYWTITVLVVLLGAYTAAIKLV